jgi:large subunit ribosomal protein L17
MRHRKKINHLGRKKAHRDAMLSNMAVSLIKHKRIHTTLAKAKALRSWVEPLLTKSKNDTTHSRRTVFSYLQDKEAVTILFREIAEKIAGRPGGYTRILKSGTRLGDSADMCYMELVDYNENLLKSSEEKKDTKGRRRRAGKKSSETMKTDIKKVDSVSKEKQVEPVEKEDVNLQEVVISTEISEDSQHEVAEVINEMPDEQSFEQPVIEELDDETKIKDKSIDENIATDTSEIKTDEITENNSTDEIKRKE